jgi:AmmeMemoRadiSam system protein B
MAEEWPAIKTNDMFYEENNFSSAVEKARVSKSNIEGNIKAIIVPHHLLASEYIAKLLSVSAGDWVKHIIIIGPNHENIGQTVAASALAKWETSLGDVASDEELVQNLLSYYGIISNPEAFRNEHSVGAIVPFIKYYLPEASIVPIIINSYAEHKDAEKLTNWLFENVDDETLIIVSTDFSHYLKKPQAEKNDELTKQMILSRDTEGVAEFNNDYIDSPISLATILLLAEKKNWRTEIVLHGNSFDFSLVKPAETTSYFGVVFGEE